jgi:hypothetical protein
MALTNCEKLRKLEDLLGGTTSTIRGFAETCTIVLPIPRRANPVSTMANERKKNGVNSPSAVTHMPIFRTNFFPSLDCIIPTGTDSNRNQRKAAEGISCASVAFRLKSELTRSTPIPTRSTKLMTKNDMRTGSIILMFILPFMIILFKDLTADNAMDFARNAERLL